MNPYHALGVPPTATPDEIKAAHSRAVKGCHPDAGGDAARFAAIQTAYEVLIHPERRRRFDETGQIDMPTASPEDGAVLSALTQIFTQVIASADFDLDHTNVAEAMLRGLVEQRMKLEAEVAKARLALDRALTLKRRFKAKRRKVAGLDPVALALDHHRMAATKNLAQAEMGLRVHARVSAALSAMRYDFDPALMQVVQSGVWTMSTGTNG